MAWAGNFVAVDGEGWKGKYTLLALSCMDYDLYNRKGLSTLDCLEYLTAWKIPANAAVVGFGLSYDFENILRDIPDKDYNKMVEKQEQIKFANFLIKYIPRKILEITRLTSKKDKRGRQIKKTVYIQDVLGFFQCSFEEALKKWNIPIPEIITEFKALRNEFGPTQIEKIKQYNREELRLLIEMMEKLKEADEQACIAVGLDINHTPRTWYGPGARASNLLKQTAWVEEHPPFTGPVAERLSKKIIDRAGIGGDSPLFEQLQKEPFSAAYYGGRIETAANGIFKGPLYDYDINSAYPFALANFPKWETEDLIGVKGLDKKERIGMYYVEWNCPEGHNFYPFPFRSKSGNVFFPRRGRGWYMSPEVYQAISIWGPESVKVLDGAVLRDTDGAGNVHGGLKPDKICSTGEKIDLMAKVRLEAKAKKESKEKSLKLTLNSCYGKTIQQVGSHKNLNLFAAAWITSICRALILQTIQKGENIVSVMTDGIVSLEPIGVNLGKNLGEFEVEEFEELIQFMPGVYKLARKDGTAVSRYRGMSRDFNPLEAMRVLYTKSEKWKINMRMFVTRRLAIHQKNVFNDLRYNFVEITKEEEFSLKSKRSDPAGNFRLTKKEGFKYYPAKEADPLELLFSGSKPYTLDVPAVLPYDTAKTMEELTEDRRIDSIINDLD